jgi:hypothetical protein
VIKADESELEAHRSYLAGLDKAAGGASLWTQVEAAPAE